MKDKVLSTIAKYDMLKQGDCVIVGLSGGADSVALLCVLSSFKAQLQITLRACHVNHNLRGEESLRDEQFCRKLCRDMGVDLIVRSVDVTGYCAANRCSVEEGARALRYAALCSIDTCAKIATAHTLSDNAETLLINLVRGAALEGLCGIPPKRDNIVRPLIDCAREEIESFLSVLGQHYVTDSTNLLDDYTRNRVRHTLVPLLQQMNPAFLQATGRTANALRSDSDLLSQLTKQALAQAEVSIKNLPMPLWAKRFENFLPARQGYDCAALANQPESVRLRCYREILLSAGQHYDFQRLHAIDRLVLSAKGSMQLDASTTVFCDKSLLIIERVMPPPDIIEQPISLSEVTAPHLIEICSGFFLKISEIERTEIKFFVNNSCWQFKNALDCDRINKILALRSRQAGDKIALVGHHCTHTLKKLLNAQSLPKALRDSLAVLSDAQGPVWIEGFGVSERAAITQETQRAVLITIWEE